MTKNHSLTIGWLYPELMSTYGDRGNIIVLQKIAEINKITITIKRINETSPQNSLEGCDLLFMGGAQDLQQEIVNRDLITKKGKMLSSLIEDGVPGLYICGAYQFLGNYYKDSYGTKIDGLGVFDMYTEAPENKDRLTGNIVIKPSIDLTTSNSTSRYIPYLVGFENHGGRTYLKDPSLAFAKVVTGYGNNGNDKSEGIHYKNSIGTYLHGPILPSNPELAVYLLTEALKRKYASASELTFDDELSKNGKMVMLKRLKTSY
jgi:CobQ-like glutamine amidotransferase family enzyme